MAVRAQCLFLGLSPESGPSRITSLLIKQKSADRSHSVQFHFCEISRIGKSIVIESRLVVLGGGGFWKERIGSGSSWVQVCFGDDENVLNLDCGDGCTTL